MTEHYLDNSATTRVSEASAEKAFELMRDNYANPSSLHSLGFSAQKELESARETLAESLGCDLSEVFFTSGGTEANNLSILGAVSAHKRNGNKIITTAYEHSSAHDSVRELQKEGFELVFLKPDSKGHINIDEIEENIDNKTVLVSVMYINNEVGAINPISEIAKIIKAKKSPALLHTDAVQAFGKIPLKASKLGADLISVSGHKLHAPKGVGALYIKKGIRILPRTFGGKQEKKIRPGTEALPLIGAFATAVKEFDISANLEKVTKLNGYLSKKLSEIDGVVINSPSDALPYILNFSYPGIRSETMLHHLSERGVYVSSGSACSKGGKSHVLEAMGLSDDIIDSAVRVSFSKHSTEEDCDALVKGLLEGINSLARSK
ncbi:MAG: cysteine desulfurase family protein [Ruminococcus sp.]